MRFFRTHDEIPEPIREAYRTGQYHFSAPPVPTWAWTDRDWINFVRFSPELEALRDNHATPSGTNR
jgi:hypothetical protein